MKVIIDRFEEGYAVVETEDKEFVDMPKKLVPVLWKIACGEPLEVVEENNEYISIPENISNKSTWLYCLIAKWDSMKDTWISEWDYLVIKQQADVNDWEIAVAIIREGFDEYATLKKIYHKANHLLLKPQNYDFEPMLLDKWVEIRWKLLWVIKSFD